jgi:HEAT repeat protein
VSNERAIRQQIGGLVDLAKDEVFEDGVDSEFVKGLSALVEAHREQALYALMNTIERGNANAEITAEVLLWLGRLTDPSSHEERLKLLGRFLQNASARVRDAASTALASMDDPKALPALKLAIERENVSDLREDMRQVLAQLESVH